jgi:hypothetical protein
MGKNIDAVASLGEDINKVKPGIESTKEGIVSSLLPELTLDMEDSELLKLAKQWESDWKPWSSRLKKKQDRNEKFVLGKKRAADDQLGDDEDSDPSSDNVLFEALETYLPLATKQSPECTVMADNTDDGTAVSEKITKMCNYLAKLLGLRIGIKTAVRYLQLYFIGYAKIGWSNLNNEVAINFDRPHKLILDPNATIKNGEYTGDYIGEVRKDKASDLIKRFPKQEEYITEMVKEKMGTEVNYTEWWTDEVLFWTLKDEVLDKVKNPHWNYGTQKDVVDEMGQTTQQEVPGANHFPKPKKPYVFLSQFNLGLHPWDDTTLVHQNISIQKQIDKKHKQIDTNVANTNGLVVVNGQFFTKEQAAQIGEAKRKGETIITPGNPNEGLIQLMGAPLPAFVYQSLQDDRFELKNNFGIAGSSASGTQSEKTVKGKVVQKQQDSDRIGGGASVYIEKFAEQIFNWFVQMMFVYYDQPHIASIVGKENAQEYITLQSADMGNRRYSVMVKEGSMIPKDSTTKQNMALQLAEAGLIDLISLYEALDFPNPRETAYKTFLSQTSPQTLYAPQQPPPQVTAGGQPIPTAPPTTGAPPPQGAMPQTVVPPVAEPTVPTQTNALPKM